MEYYYSKIINNLSKVLLLMVFLCSSLLEVKANEATGRIFGSNALEVVLLRTTPDDVVYGGTWGDGLYKTLNKGVDWSKVTALNAKYVNYISFGTSGNDIYVSTADEGLFKSNDGGNSFTKINNGLPRLNTKVIIRKTTDTLYCGTNGDGIYKSTNAGADWFKSDSGLYYQNVNDLCITKSGRIIVGTYGGGIYKSDDAGKSFSKNVGGFVMKYVNRIARVKNDKIVIAGNGGLYESVDDGQMFQQYGVKLDNTLKDNNITDVVYANNNLPSLIEEPVITTKYRGIWRYDSRTYEDWLIASGYGGFNTITRIKDGTLLAATAGKGIMMSGDNGKTWAQTGYKLYASDRYIKLLSSDNDFYSFLPYDTLLQKTTDIGVSWSKNINPSKQKIVGMDVVGNNVVVGDVAKTVFISTNGGSNWSQSSPNAIISSIAISPSNPQNIFIFSEPEPEGGPPPPPPPPPTIEVFKSSDGGNTWVKLTAKMNANKSQPLITNNGYIYVAVQSYGAKGVHKIFLSKDDGQTFSLTSFNKNDDQSLIVNSMKYYSNALYVASSDGLYKSDDDGLTFTVDKLGFKAGAYESANINTIGFRSTNDIYLGMGSDFGIFKTSNAGVKWDSINSSFVVKNVNGMAVNKNGDILFSTNSIHRITNPVNMEIPVVTAPAKNAVAIDFNPTIEWGTSKKATLYEMQISEDRFFGTSVETPVIAYTKWKMIHSLSPNTKYYVQVRGKDFGSYSDWSKEYSFTTKLAKPVLITPINGKKGVEVRPVLVWNKVDGGQKFNIELSETKDFKTPLFHRENVTDTSITVDQTLKNLTTYYWRAQAFGKDGNLSDWSEIGEFFTKLPPPTLIYPANQAKGLSQVIEFKWSLVPEAEKAWIQVGEKADFLSDVFFSSMANEVTSHTLTKFEYNKTYYWRAYVQNEDGTSDYSETWQFTTSVPKAQLISPQDKSITNPLEVELSWGEVNKATAYDVELYNGQTIKEDPIFNANKITDANTFVKDLKPFTYYSWRVKVYVDSLESEWSQLFTFRTELDKVKLVSPENNATNQVLSALYLNWLPVEGATQFIIQTDIQENFVTQNLKEWKNWTLNKVDLNNLSEKTTYYWRVKPLNKDEEGKWSDTWSFITTEKTSVKDLINQFEVGLYPNPSKDNTIINFTLTEISGIRIAVYALNGQQILNKDFGVLEVGQKHLPVELQGVSSGTYQVFIEVTTLKGELTTIPLNLIISK